LVNFFSTLKQNGDIVLDMSELFFTRECSRCGEKYDMSLVTNLLLSPTVKEFWKSFNINQSNKWSNGTFLWPRVQIHTYFTLLTSLAIQMSTFNQMFKLTPQEAFIDKYVTFSTFYFSFIHLW